MTTQTLNTLLSTLKKYGVERFNLLDLTSDISDLNLNAELSFYNAKYDLEHTVLFIQDDTVKSLKVGGYYKACDCEFKEYYDELDFEHLEGEKSIFKVDDLSTQLLSIKESIVAREKSIIFVFQQEKIDYPDEVSFTHCTKVYMLPEYFIK